jgi:hypothetical protein
MLKNSFQYTLHIETRDPKDVSTQKQRLSLVALYGPNEDCLFESVNSKLVSLSNPSIIIGGHLNVVQDFSFDTDDYLHKNNLKYHDTILEISSYLDLINVCRNMHTEERRFTWHGPNSRLDYFLISSDLEGFIKRSQIGLSYKSDHSPLSVSFQFHNQERGCVTWKFINSLLYDPDYVTLVNKLYALRHSPV